MIEARVENHGRSADQSGAPIQSVERAVRILGAVARQREGARLSDISRELGLHVSTVFNLAKSLVALGCLRVEEGGKRYRIGRTILSLSASCHDERALVEVTQPFLRKLAEVTGESSHFAVWSGDQVLILARSQGQGAFQLAEHLGALRPAYATAIGKALLGGLTKRELDGWFGRVDLSALTEKTILEPDTLRRQIERVRAEEIAYDDGEYNPEARCVAAPVRGASGKVVGSIGISGPIWRVSLHDIAEHASRVRDVARQLSGELGYIELGA